MIITVVFDRSVKLGIVRAFTNQAAQCLPDIVNRALVKREVVLVPSDRYYRRLTNKTIRKNRQAWLG